jgi:hypothetical protein
LNDQNFTSPCLIRQAKHFTKHLSTSQPYSLDEPGLIFHFHDFSSIFNLFCTL